MPIALDAVGGKTMSDLLTNQVTPVANFIVDQLPEVGNAIATDPVLGLTLGFLVIGGVIGLFGRLISRG